jgi:hypothetical protein
VYQAFSFNLPRISFSLAGPPPKRAAAVLRIFKHSAAGMSGKANDVFAGQGYLAANPLTLSCIISIGAAKGWIFP